MKKLIVAVAALFAVVGMVGAAELNWGTAGGAVDQDGNLLLNNGAAYLLYLGSNGILETTFDASTGKWSYGDDSIVSGGNLFRESEVSYVSSAANFSSFVPSATAGQVFAVLITTADYTGDGNDPATSGFYGFSDSKEATTNKSGDFDNLMFNSQIKADIPVVPEPTTYALVGLAAAALALRKRFLKK